MRLPQAISLARTATAGGADPGAAAVAAPFSARRLIVGTGIASLIAPFNSSMIAVALPSIRSDFGIGVGAATWLISSYLIAVAVSQPVGGRLGDAFGHRAVVVIGLIVMALFSLGAALAWNYELLVATRTVQGVAAALVMPNAVAYLRKKVPAHELGRVLGANGSAVSSGAALGPVIGGLLLAVGNWRWLFLANVPAGAVALVLILRLEADEGRGRSALGLDGLSLGLLLASFTGMALLGTANRIGSVPLLVACMTVLPIGAIGYYLRYRAKQRGVVDLQLFTRRNYSAPAACVALGNLVMYSTLIAIPVYLDDVKHTSDAVVGLLLFSMSVAVVAISPFAGRYSDRLGARPLVMAGAMVSLGGAAVLLAVLGHGTIALLSFPLLLIGLGLGLAQAAQQSAALQAWPREMAGSASGTFSMMRYVGSVTGAAIIAAVLGAHPDVTAFRELFAVLVLFAIATVGAAWFVRSEKPIIETA